MSRPIIELPLLAIAAVMVHLASKTAGADESAYKRFADPEKLGCDGYRCWFPAADPFCRLKVKSAWVEINGKTGVMNLEICRKDEIERYKKGISVCQKEIGQTLIPGQEYVVGLEYRNGEKELYRDKVRFSRQSGMNYGAWDGNTPENGWTFVQGQSGGAEHAPLLAVRYIKPTIVAGHLEYRFFFDPCEFRIGDEYLDDYHRRWTTYFNGKVRPLKSEGLSRRFVENSPGTSAAESYSTKKVEVAFGNKAGDILFGPYTYDFDARAIIEASSDNR